MERFPEQNNKPESDFKLVSPESEIKPETIDERFEREQKEIEDSMRRAYFTQEMMSDTEKMNPTILSALFEEYVSEHKLFTPTTEELMLVKEAEKKAETIKEKTKRKLMKDFINEKVSLAA